jgi:hypothetical protein
MVFRKLQVSILMSEVTTTSAACVNFEKSGCFPDRNNDTLTSAVSIPQSLISTSDLLRLTAKTSKGVPGVISNAWKTKITAPAGHQRMLASVQPLVISSNRKALFFFK